MARGDERWVHGTAAYASQFRLPHADVYDHLSELLGERMATEAINAAGGAWADGSLSLRERSLIVLTALAAQGGVDDRLRLHARWALDHGISIDELETLLTLLALYVGYPRASMAMEIVRDVARAEQNANG